MSCQTTIISKLHGVKVQRPVFFPKWKYCQYQQEITKNQILNFSPIVLKIMPSFYLERCTGLKWVKREHLLPHVLNLSPPNSFLESFVNRTQNSSESSTPFRRLRFKRGSFVRSPSNGEGFRDIQQGMSMVLDTRFYI